MIKITIIKLENELIQSFSLLLRERDPRNTLNNNVSLIDTENEILENVSVCTRT